MLAEAEVALQKRAKFERAFTALGREEPQGMPIAERVARLEHTVRGLVRLHVAGFEMLRQWARTEVGHPDWD